MSSPKPGWYPDPSGDMSRVRYWNGEKWTDQYQEVPDFTQPEQQATQQSTPDSVIVTTTYAQNSQDSTLRLIAFIFCILSLAASCIFIIPLAWMIPMSVRAWGIYKGTKPNTVAFGVCTLIFVSLIAGILLLVSSKDE